MEIKDGTRIYLGAAELQQIYNCDNAETIKSFLDRLMDFQKPFEKPHPFLNKKINLPTEERQTMFFDGQQIIIDGAPCVAFLCDQQAACKNSMCCGKECKRTLNIEHAKNFEKVNNIKYAEKYAEKRTV
jgi:hypothetical protein